MKEISIGFPMQTVLGTRPLLAHGIFVQIRNTSPLERLSLAGAMIGRRMVAHLNFIYFLILKFNFFHQRGNFHDQQANEKVPHVHIDYGNVN